MKHEAGAPPVLHTYVNISIDPSRFQSKLGSNQRFIGLISRLLSKMKTEMAARGRGPTAPSVGAYFNRHYPEEPLGGDGTCLHFLSFQTKSKKLNGNGP